MLSLKSSGGEDINQNMSEPKIQHSRGSFDGYDVSITRAETSENKPKVASINHLHAQSQFVYKPGAALSRSINDRLVINGRDES